MRIYRSSRPEPLRLNTLQATVAAEWDVDGCADIVWGDIITLRKQDALCLLKNCTEHLAPKQKWVFGIRHLDLQTIAGISAVLGCKPQNASFWKLAHATQASQNLQDNSVTSETKRMYDSWIMWQDMHPLPDTHCGAIQDVTAEFLEALQTLDGILGAS